MKLRLSDSGGGGGSRGRQGHWPHRDLRCYGTKPNHVLILSSASNHTPLIISSTICAHIIRRIGYTTLEAYRNNIYTSTDH